MTLVYHERNDRINEIRQVSKVYNGAVVGAMEGSIDKWSELEI